MPVRDLDGNVTPQLLVIASVDDPESSPAEWNHHLVAAQAGRSLRILPRGDVGSGLRPCAREVADDRPVDQVFPEDGVDYLDVTSEPLAVGRAGNHFALLLAVKQFQLEQLPQQERTCLRRHLFQVVLDLRLLARSPGVLKAITKGIQTLGNVQGQGLAASQSRVAHGWPSWRHNSRMSASLRATV